MFTQGSSVCALALAPLQVPPYLWPIDWEILSKIDGFVNFQEMPSINLMNVNDDYLDLVPKQLLALTKLKNVIFGIARAMAWIYDGISDLLTHKLNNGVFQYITRTKRIIKQRRWLYLKVINDRDNNHPNV